MGYRNFANFGLCLLLICGLFEWYPAVYEIFKKCSVAVCVYWLAMTMMKFSRSYFLNKKVSSHNRAILITGCDSGFGHLLAKRMSALGFKIFACCLDVSGEGAIALQKHRHGISVLPLDVTSDRSVESAKESVMQQLGKHVLWGVVNNAGIAQGGEVDWTPMSEFQRSHEVNTFGTVRVTKAFLPLLRKARGRVVNTTSTCGKFICPGFVAYCMSKSSGIAFTTGLRIEMLKWKIKAISIEPFFYKTPITQTEGLINLIEKTWKGADANTRAIYGEDYKEGFKSSCCRLMKRASPHTYQVIDCFEDALTAEEPLAHYNPAFWWHKLGIAALQALPVSVSDVYNRCQLEGGVRPAAKLDKKARTDWGFVRIWWHEISCLGGREVSAAWLGREE